MIIVSHRGPYTFTVEPDGQLSARRGAGGVVSALGPLLHGGIDGHDGTPTWIAAAIGAGDHEAARRGDAHVPGVELVLLDLPEEAHRLHYDVVSNEVLWFLHHGIFDLARTPAFGPDFGVAWAAYREVNQHFADAVCAHAAANEIVFVQDYQLALVPALVTAQRPDLRTMLFTHIPFCGPSSIRVLPDAIAEEYCRALSETVTLFHTERWARAYCASVREILGVDPQQPSFAVPLGPEPDALATACTEPDADAARAWLRDRAGERALIVRTDRIEPTKNIVRGFDAYELFLEQHPEWHDRVTFVACCYRSREGIPEYQRYAAAVEATVTRINERFGSAAWQPIVLDVRDDYIRSVIALEQFDVLLVNSLKDGMNLVAMEGPTVNGRNGITICSRDAGAYDHMAKGVLGVNPYDLSASADAIAAALTMDASERERMATTARALAATCSPQTWLAGCLAHAPH